jgi:hypothetical protein
MALARNSPSTRCTRSKRLIEASGSGRTPQHGGPKLVAIGREWNVAWKTVADAVSKIHDEHFIYWIAAS